MRKALLYYGSTAICCGYLGVRGISAIRAGNVNPIPILLAISGIGAVFTGGYQVFLSSDPSDSLPDDRLVWFTAAMAVLFVLSRGWSLLG